MKANQLIDAARAAAGPKEKSEMSGNAWTIHIERTPIHTLDQLVEHCKIDLSVWEVDRFQVNKWEVAMKGHAAFTEIFPTKDGREIPMWQRKKKERHPVHENLFQVKAWLKKKTDIVEARKEIEELKKLAKVGAWKPIHRKPSPDTGNMLEIAPVDHHLGMLAWSRETGHANYDTKIAEALFDKAFDEILARTSVYKLDEIWIVLGNDLLHTDDTEGRTTSGTYVSSPDSRFHKTFSTARNMAIRNIEKCRHATKRVFVVVVPGNHDRRSAWHLGDSLQAWFKGCQDVVIDNEPRSFKCHRFGSVMLMFAHGDKGKRRNYPLLMATENSKMFGETTFREVHTGDKHHERVEEQHGVKVRILPTLCPPDAWHAENAYMGNIRATEAFVWNKNKGLLGTAIFTATHPHES